VVVVVVVTSPFVKPSVLKSSIICIQNFNYCLFHAFFCPGMCFIAPQKEKKTASGCGFALDPTG